MSEFTSSSNKSVKEEASESIKKSLEKCQVLTHSSLDLGNHTLNGLMEQEGKMNDVEKIMDDNSVIIAESLRRLRGMTWTGMIYNAVASLSQPIITTGSTKNPSADPPSASNPNPPSNAQNDYGRSSTDPPLFEVRPERPPLSEEDKMLEELARSVSSLHTVSVTIGEALESSTKQIDRLDLNADKLHDETLYASLRASRLTASKASSSLIKPIALFQFITDDGLLASIGDKLVVTKDATRSCIFGCYVKNQIIIGMRSETTLKYLGCTIWGTIAISGEYFGSQEECFVDLNGRRSGLLLMSRNFGAGGWLKKEGVGMNEAGDVVLGLTTTSVMDKEGMIFFTAIKCGEIVKV
ncbi:hypothetical protein EON65_20745 [archaeon]|nr:MAG: hypothetical protein EON65_20745 [archaeon]